jgi:hypothetical protein
MFESTPYRTNHKTTNVIQSKVQIEDVLSNISSSSSSILEQSFDVKDIVRQVKSMKNMNELYCFFSFYRKGCFTVASNIRKE